MVGTRLSINRRGIRTRARQHDVLVFSIEPRQHQQQQQQMTPSACRTDETTTRLQHPPMCARRRRPSWQCCSRRNPPSRTTCPTSQAATFTLYAWVPSAERGRSRHTNAGRDIDYMPFIQLQFLLCTCVSRTVGRLRI